ncbi:MAG TPA: HAMP domain-containing sensor histidine kinase [Thermoanaerobaculia bacterium]|nr:HAMP domain-containing sensor histidine kinase [Thermoanaerobaculia bacterium]
MSQDLLLFAQLVIFLTGAVLYGFLASDLLHQPRAFASTAMRLLVACLGFWYAGCFIAELTHILLPGLVPERFASAFGLVRGFAWLLSFPLLVHASWSLTEQRPSRIWLVPGYFSIGLFLPAAARAWQGRGVGLGETARQVYPLVLVHATLAGAITAWLLGAALGRAPDLRQARFLRWLLAGVALMVALIAGGAAARPVAALAPAGVPGPAAGGALWGEALWRLSSELSSLVLGLVFLAFVQRYGLLRLSLSRRSMRRLLYVIGAMALLTLAGPAVGIAGTAASRRLVAGGLLVALAAAAIAIPAERLARRRFPGLRRLLGQAVRADEIEELTRRLRSWTFAESELRSLTAEELTRWLGVRARFVPAPADFRDPSRGSAGSKAGGGGAGPRAAGREGEGDAHGSRGASAAEWGLWRHFSDPETRAVNRLDEPSARLATLLDRADLQAAFPLRVAGALDSVLGLEIGDAAAGYEEGEREAVQVVVNQLAAVLEVRRSVAAQLAAERRLAEHERLSLLGLVAASLAHELKNPLSSMKALTQTVLEERERADPGGDQAQDLRLIVEQIDRLHEVAREMLSFVRKPPEGAALEAAARGGSEGGSPTAAPGEEAVALSPMLRSTLYILRHLARQRGVEIEADELCEVGRVRGTAAAWQTVLFNLSLNAVQHAPASSKVRIGLSREGRHASPSGGEIQEARESPDLARRESAGRVTFWTENTGPAIDPQIVRRFQATARAGAPDPLPAPAGAAEYLAAAGSAPEYLPRPAGAPDRLPTAPAGAPQLPLARGEGTGLGLALVAQRVRELAGEVTLESSPELIVFRVQVPDPGEAR